MKKIIFMLCTLFTIPTLASVTGVKCKIDGSVSLNGKETKFSDNTIKGHVTDEEMISFNDSDPNYAHVKIVKLQSGQTLKYTIEGYDVRNGLGTVAVRTFRNGASHAQTTSYFTMPLKQKRFIGINGTNLGNESSQYKITCDWI